MNERKAILLVEDEPLVAMVEKRTLEKSGYAVITAGTGEQALAILGHSRDVDLVLMDIDLGDGIDGTEAAEQILLDRDLPVVFLSSHTEPEVVQKTEGITSYGYIVKNSGETVLLASIKMAFRLFEAHVGLRTQKERLDRALVQEEQAHEQLESKSEELERYFSSSLDMLCIANIEGEFVRLNPEWEKVLGYSLSELEGRPFMDFVHPDDQEPTHQAVSRLAVQQEVLSFENRFRCKDGSYRWIEWRSRPVGEMIYAVARDVTGRKQAEDALREREALFRNLMENSIDGVELLDEDGNFLDVNSRECEMTGYSREELLRMSIADIDPNYPAGGFKEFWKRQPKGASVLFETLHKHKSGRLIPVEVNGIFFEVGGKRYVYGLARDITERKERERRITESERKLRVTMESIGDGVITTDAQGNVVKMNSIAESLCGWSRDEACGRSLLDVFRIVNAETRAPVNNPVIKVLESGKIAGLADHTVLITKDGAEYQIADSAAPIRDDDGTVNGVVLVFRDVTEQYETERRLRERAKELNCLYKMSEILDEPNITLESILQKTAEMLPASWLYPEEAACRITIQDSEYRSCGFTIGERVLTSEVWAESYQLGSVEIHYPRELKAAGETADDCPFLDEERTLLNSIAERIGRTIERKRSEETLLREVQHRVKNTMNTMVSLLTLEADRMSDNPAAAEALSDASSRFRSMGVLYDQLYRVGDHTSVSVEDYITELVQQLAALFPAGDAVRLRFHVQDFMMEGRRLSSLGMIVNELVTNAMKYAFRERGAGELSVSVQHSDGQARLVVEDDGPGMPADFDAHHHAGFGLTMIETLAQNLDGEVRFEQNRGLRAVLEFTV